jgi:ribosomal protein L11 methyltransferase
LTWNNVEDAPSLFYREEWPADRRPIRVGRTLVIGPPGTGVVTGPGDRAIELDLGVSDPSQGVLFGTGAHPTTRLMLDLLGEWLNEGERVLDAGTGTGVLALAAARLGASDALAVDTDPLCALAARANVRLNRLEAIVRVQEGSVEAVADGPYDGVLANLLAPAIIAMAPDLARLAGRFLIVSGVTATRALDVHAALEGKGLRREAERATGDWRALVYTRGGNEP